jgi:hypothetical protein
MNEDRQAEPATNHPLGGTPPKTNHKLACTATIAAEPTMIIGTGPDIEPDLSGRNRNEHVSCAHIYVSTGILTRGWLDFICDYRADFPLFQ